MRKLNDLNEQIFKIPGRHIQFTALPPNEMYKSTIPHKMQTMRWVYRGVIACVKKYGKNAGTLSSKKRR